jgi:hypothetical protein
VWGVGLKGLGCDGDPLVKPSDAEIRSDQVLEMMQHPGLIEQAKGMLMTRR